MCCSHVLFMLAIVNIICNTCAFLSMTSQNFYCEKGLWEEKGAFFSMSETVLSNCFSSIFGFDEHHYVFFHLMLYILFCLYH